MGERTPVIEKALEKLKEKKIRIGCPTCGGQPDWSVVENPVTPLFLNDELESHIMDKGIGLMMLACSKCGFVTFHSLEILLKG